MRNCANCGKANQPTRKYCIRCGRSLISAPSPKKRESSPVPELGKVTTGESLKKESEATSAEIPTPVDEEEQWVKPSEVSRDRMRTTTGSTRMTELEKARAAFARAEEVGIDEDETGVVVTRMLRASEVKELMEGVSEMPTVEEYPDDEPIIGPPPIAAPSPQDIEEQILGSKSAYVDKPIVETEPEMQAADDARVSPELASDFSSSKYDTIVAETIPDEPVPVVSKPITPEPEPVTEPPEGNSTDLSYDAITACPSCGEIINIDTFEYPKEIYSAMGAARMKQARFFVVQGKYDEAQKIVRVARSLFIKAKDDNGIAEVNKLVDSLARRS